MWEFLRSALEAHGLNAVVLLVVVGGAGIAMRELWKKNQELGVHYRKMLQEEAQKRSEMRAAHDREIDSLRQELQLRTEAFAERLDELHEKRNAESRETIREIITVANEMRGAAATTAEVLTFMRETVSRRGS